jgi:hypothetical protein
VEEHGREAVHGLVTGVRLGRARGNERHVGSVGRGACGVMPGLID